ncbi:hypothetical protein BH10BAC3_BH10BAC3_06470 [soil metagenome]
MAVFVWKDKQQVSTLIPDLWSKNHSGQKNKNCRFCPGRFYLYSEMIARTTINIITAIKRFSGRLEK